MSADDLPASPHGRGTENHTMPPSGPPVRARAPRGPSVAAGRSSVQQRLVELAADGCKKKKKKKKNGSSSSSRNLWSGDGKWKVKLVPKKKRRSKKKPRTETDSGSAVGASSISSSTGPSRKRKLTEPTAGDGRNETASVDGTTSSSADTISTPITPIIPSDPAAVGLGAAVEPSATATVTPSTVTPTTTAVANVMSAVAKNRFRLVIERVLSVLVPRAINVLDELLASPTPARHLAVDRYGRLITVAVQSPTDDDEEEQCDDSSVFSMIDNHEMVFDCLIDDLAARSDLLVMWIKCHVPPDSDGLNNTDVDVLNAAQATMLDARRFVEEARDETMQYRIKQRFAGVVAEELPDVVDAQRRLIYFYWGEFHAMRRLLDELRRVYVVIDRTIGGNRERIERSRGPDDELPRLGFIR